MRTASTLIVAIFCLTSFALGGTASAAASKFKYVGAKDCGKCHKKDLIGNQLGEWKKSEHHKAYETLKGDDAAKIAKERGLAKPAYESEECLKCHVTGYGLPASAFQKKPLLESDGVQCESCHGPGSGYRKKKTMSDPDKAIAAGMWEPGKDEKICTNCHNSDSPTWDAAKGFDYKEMKKKIAHPIPEDVKGHYIEKEKELRAQKGSAGGDDEEEEEQD